MPMIGCCSCGCLNRVLITSDAPLNYEEDLSLPYGFKYSFGEVDWIPNASKVNVVDDPSNFLSNPTREIPANTTLEFEVTVPCSNYMVVMTVENRGDGNQITDRGFKLRVGDYLQSTRDIPYCDFDVDLGQGGDWVYMNTYSDVADKHGAGVRTQAGHASTHKLIDDNNAGDITNYKFTVSVGEHDGWGTAEAFGFNRDRYSKVTIDGKDEMLANVSDAVAAMAIEPAPAGSRTIPIKLSTGDVPLVIGEFFVMHGTCLHFRNYTGNYDSTPTQEVRFMRKVPTTTFTGTPPTGSFGRIYPNYVSGADEFAYLDITVDNSVFTGTHEWKTVKDPWLCYKFNGGYADSDGSGVGINGIFINQAAQSGDGNGWGRIALEYPADGSAADKAELESARSFHLSHTNYLFPDDIPDLFQFVYIEPEVDLNYTFSTSATCGNVTVTTNNVFDTDTTHSIKVGLHHGAVGFDVAGDFSFPAITWTGDCSTGWNFDMDKSVGLLNGNFYRTSDIWLDSSANPDAGYLRAKTESNGDSFYANGATYHERGRNPYQPPMVLPVILGSDCDVYWDRWDGSQRSNFIPNGHYYGEGLATLDAKTSQLDQTFTEIYWNSEIWDDYGNLVHTHAVSYDSCMINVYNDWNSLPSGETVNFTTGVVNQNDPKDDVAPIVNKPLTYNEYQWAAGRIDRNDHIYDEVNERGVMVFKDGSFEILSMTLAEQEYGNYDQCWFYTGDCTQGVFDEYSNETKITIDEGVGGANAEYIYEHARNLLTIYSYDEDKPEQWWLGFKGNMGDYSNLFIIANDKTTEYEFDATELWSFLRLSNYAKIGRKVFRLPAVDPTYPDDYIEFRLRG